MIFVWLPPELHLPWRGPRPPWCPPQLVTRRWRRSPAWCCCARRWRGRTWGPSGWSSARRYGRRSCWGLDRSKLPSIESFGTINTININPARMPKIGMRLSKARVNTWKGRSSELRRSYQTWINKPPNGCLTGGTIYSYQMKRLLGKYPADVNKLWFINPGLTWMIRCLWMSSG